MLKDTKQAIRTKSTNWKAIAELERNKRLELQKKMNGLQDYHRHLEDEQVELLLTRIQKSENFSDNAARMIKQHEFKSNILEKENIRLKKMIYSKNAQMKEDEERIHKLSEASKGLFEELQLSREHIKSLEEKIYQLEHQHKISLQKAGNIVDDYFKYKFLDAGIPNAEVVLEPISKKSKDKLPQNPSDIDVNVNMDVDVDMIMNMNMNINQLDTDIDEQNSQHIFTIVDENFEKQLKFLENINL
jgi:hypothetical protein